ncbi:MAG: DUF1564 family protein [Leptospiraceae bacterium]|nr:DUF1564 family protein [Leptospiraceae bacterium]
MNPIHHGRTQSTLLIPEKFLDEFLKRTEEISRDVYFRGLLKRYRYVVLCKTFAKSSRVKISYQEKGQHLVKKNFYPQNDDWVEFGLLANWLGISRTALFTWFLILDLAGWDKILREKFYDNGVPPKITAIRVGSYIATRKTVRADRHIRYKQRH